MKGYQEEIGQRTKEKSVKIYVPVPLASFHSGLEQGSNPVVICIFVKFCMTQLNSSGAIVCLGNVCSHGMPRMLRVKVSRGTNSQQSLKFNV